MFHTLRGRVTATYFVVVIVSLLLASAFFLVFLTRYIRNRDREDLRKQVGAVAQDIGQVVQATERLFSQENGASAVPGEAPPGVPPVDEQAAATSLVTNFLNTESQVLQVKLAVVSPDGQVVAESEGRPSFGADTLQLPPDIFSYRGARITERFFQRLGRSYVFATAPTTLTTGGSGFLLAIKPVEQVRHFAGALILYVVVAGLMALAISMGLSFYLSSAISQPVRAVTEAARAMAAGDYSQEVEVKGSDETAELARDFNMMASRVRTAYDLQRNFVGNVSHELRTPLTSIEGFSQALLDGVSTSPEERKRSLEIINHESKRLVRVLRDLLLLSQIDAGEVKLEKKKIDLVDFMRNLANLYATRAQDAGVVLNVDLPGSLEFSTDPDRLERVVTNLLENAIKYTGAGGSVKLRAQAPDDRVRIDISDTGAGIPEDQLERIFDRFHRVEQSRAQKHGGSGLGLSISKELVETLGGTIEVASAVGQGSTFTVVLPVDGG